MLMTDCRDRFLASSHWPDSPRNRFFCFHSMKTTCYFFSLKILILIALHSRAMRYLLLYNINSAVFSLKREIVSTYLSKL